MSLWKSYVDDTISYLKEEFIEHILSKLNGYHDNIKFTYEIEKDDNQSFLGVIVMRKDCEVEAAIYHGSTNNGLHLRWQSFACGLVQCGWRGGGFSFWSSAVFCWYQEKLILGEGWALGYNSIKF